MIRESKNKFQFFTNNMKFFLNYLYVIVVQLSEVRIQFSMICAIRF